MTALRLLPRRVRWRAERRSMRSCRRAVRSAAASSSESRRSVTCWPSRCMCIFTLTGGLPTGLGAPDAEGSAVEFWTWLVDAMAFSSARLPSSRDCELSVAC
ncbi:hypothetical protein KC350_g25 [Hortaea werneckii]|nr:hypothetical protein KC350_g25 [Hortaea werneckii]